MQLSQAFVALLSVSAAAPAFGVPVRNAASSKAVTRSQAEPMERALDLLASRGLSSDVEQKTRTIIARYAHIPDQAERDMLVARDMHKRGILDTLVSALAQIINELLGTSSQSRRDLNLSSDSIDQLKQVLQTLSRALAQQAKTLGSNSSSSANSTASAAASTSTSKASNAKTSAKQDKHDKRHLVERQEGVQGVLEVLRGLVDAILNTLLPMSSRGDDDSSSSSSGKNCPPAGTPNDGMYRPGCPGYGRRDVGDASSGDVGSQLKSMLPVLEMLIEKLPQLISEGISGANNSTSNSTSSSSSTPSGTSKSSGKASKASTTGQAPLSAAKLSLDTRSLLDADGFQFTKRADSPTANDGGSSQDGNDGGLNVSLLDNLLNNVLGGVLSGGSDSTKTSSSSKTNDSDPSGTANNGGTSQDGNGGGVNVSVLNNLLNSLLGGLLSRRDIDSGFPHKMLFSLLQSPAGQHAKRAAFTMATRSLLTARADFKPVWDEVKKVGNSHFTHERRDADQGLAPVWNSFRDMVDSGYAEGVQRRSPNVDTSAFTRASAAYLKQHVFSQHARRDAEQYKPLLNAAGGFAKSQMKEWTDALNQHNKANAY